MKIADLINHVKRGDPKLLGGIPENKAKALVRAVFGHINNTLSGTQEGVVIFAGLGRFRIRKVERDIEGKKISQTRIIFRRAEPGKGQKRSSASNKTN